MTEDSRIVLAGERIEAGMMVTVRTDGRGRRTAHRAAPGDRPAFTIEHAADEGDPVEAEPVEVRIPPDEHRASPPEQQLWDLMGGIIHGACEQIGTQAAWGVILSRCTRELRRQIGVDGAKTVLDALRDMQEEAARGDR